jgi:hypothetical protein
MKSVTKITLIFLIEGTLKINIEIMFKFLKIISVPEGHYKKVSRAKNACGQWVGHPCIRLFVRLLKLSCKINKLIVKLVNVFHSCKKM